MKKTISLVNLIKLFCVFCMGCYFALMVEFGIDFTLGAGFGISTLGAVLAPIVKNKIQKS